MEEDFSEYCLTHKMYTPTGVFIGMCSKDKLAWYLKKKLAILGEDKSVKLTFEPQFGKRVHRNIVPRKFNKCTICAANAKDIKITPYHVIPLIFKKHFPIDKKSHVSNDIVPMCPGCISDANSLNDWYIVQLYEEFKMNPKMRHNSNINFLTKYLKNEFKLKNEKINNKIADIIGIKDFTIDDVEAYVELEKDICPEEKIVKKCIIDGNLNEFIKDWKTMFVENMEPKCLAEDFFNEDTGWV